MYILFLSLFCLVIAVGFLTLAITNSHTKNAFEEKADQLFKRTQFYENIHHKDEATELLPMTKAHEIVLNIGEAQVKLGQSLEAMDLTKKEINRCVEVYKSTQQKPVQFIPKAKPELRVISNQVNSK